MTRYTLAHKLGIPYQRLTYKLGSWSMKWAVRHRPRCNVKNSSKRPKKPKWEPEIEDILRAEWAEREPGGVMPGLTRPRSPEILKIVRQLARERKKEKKSAAARTE